ncbi:MAG: hypothetical protein JXJ22_09695 [Bacteroidales bacterium]|nr:hypothetical protein [Bacteroidales bacterium]
MKKTLILLIALFGILKLSFCTDPVKQITKVWETDSIFWTPESAVYDNESGFLYATNFNDRGGFRKKEDTLYNECITKMDLDGNVIEFKWVDSLIGPTGITIYKDKLYVVERGYLTQIDIKKAKIEKRFPIDYPGFPNDVTVDSEGNVYISDSGNKTIYKLNNGKVELWLESEELRGINGILSDNDKLIVGAGDNYLKFVDIQTKEIQNIAFMGEGAIDGIKKCGDDYLVSHFQGNLYLVKKTGDVIELINTREQNITMADFEYIEDKNMMVIPALMNNRVIGYLYK